MFITVWLGGQNWQVKFDRHVQKLKTEYVKWLASDISGGTMICKRWLMIWNNRLCNIEKQDYCYQMKWQYQKRRKKA